MCSPQKRPNRVFRTITSGHAWVKVFSKVDEWLVVAEITPEGAINIDTLAARSRH